MENGDGSLQCTNCKVYCFTNLSSLCLTSCQYWGDDKYEEKGGEVGQVGWGRAKAYQGWAEVVWKTTFRGQFMRIVMTVSSILMFNYWYMKVKLNQIPPISPIVSNVNVTLTLLYLTLSNDQLYSGRTGQVRNTRVDGRVLGLVMVVVLYYFVISNCMSLKCYLCQLFLVSICLIFYFILDILHSTAIVTLT